MKTYYCSGIEKEEQFFLDNSDEFYIQEIDPDAPDRYVYPNDNIKYELDDALVSLYDKFRDVFFPNTSLYYAELSSLPIWVQEAGQNSDCSISAKTFEQWSQPERQKDCSNLFRHLYLVDCQFLVGTIQNLLQGMDSAFVSYYISISSIGNNIRASGPNSTMFQMSPSVTSISSLLESYFTKAYSILDMLSKIGYELENPQDDFAMYHKLKSAKLLWGSRKNLKINNTRGTLFEDCEIVRMIESLRNELVHNGSWELNPKVFVRFQDNIIVEKFMLFPDISDGHLATVKNRRHFFETGSKVNYILPKFHQEFNHRLLQTVLLLN